MNCVHMGNDTGQAVTCPSCRGTVQLKLFECAVHKRCTQKKQVGAVACCATCSSYSARGKAAVEPAVAGVIGSSLALASAARWAYAITTVPGRPYLESTLQSLAAAGFDKPFVHVDPGVGAYGNWVLTLWELYLREPTADRYAVFQDDLQACTGLRSYLDACRMPERGYWNMFTFRTNEPVVQGKQDGWHEAGLLDGNSTQQTGRGALALAFSLEGVQTLLSSRHMVDHVRGVRNSTCNIDGAVVSAMNKAGWREHIHKPSLVRHVGVQSSIPNKAHSRLNLPYPEALTWTGTTRSR